VKPTLFILLNFYSLVSFSKERAFFGKVTDEKGVAIPYCVVQAKDRNKGVFSDEYGRFYFKEDPDSVTAIIFYTIGYEKKELPLKNLAEDSVRIVLRQSNIQLNEVAITPKKGKIKVGVLGKRNISNKISPGHQSGKAYGKYGTEWGIFLKSDSARDGFLKEVFVYVTDEGIPTTKFRIHVYEADLVTWMPSKDITDSNVIVHANRGNEWVRVDLSNKSIPVKVGVTISVEWISGHGNNPNKWSNYISDSLNGQVIGMTQDYWRRGYITGHHNVFNGEWEFKQYPNHWKKNFINLMIYATYTYLKE